MMNGTGTESAHIALDSDCFSNATVSTRSCTPDWTSDAATIAVEPPTEPAVCTRSSGLPDGAERLGEVELGHHHALEQVGRLADDDGVDVVERHVRRRRARGRWPRGTGRPSRRPRAWRGGGSGRRRSRRRAAWPSVASLRAQRADEVLLQRRALTSRARAPCRRSPAQIRLAASPMRIRPPVNIGLPASAPPEGLIATSSAQAELGAQDQLLVAERRVQLGDLDPVEVRRPAAARRPRGSGSGRGCPC